MEKGTCKLENEVEGNISEESTHSDSSPITYVDRTQRPSPSPAVDKDVQMRDSSCGSEGEVSLGQGHHAACATAAIFPPSDSNAPTPIPHARHPGQAEASGAATSSPVVPGHHHLQPQHVTVVSAGADAPPSSTASQAQASTQPLQEQPQPAAVYHYPFPTYPPPRFLGGANDILRSSAPAAQYTSTSYYHRPYYVSATTSNGAADITSAQRPPSSYAAPAQPPIPIVVSSSRLQ
ncbi:hypothetical protein CPB84DRAFT_1217804 [Gymnopilus junonius]|uniref:Uncharacterized protein n=1 Tax=Gymnopilus junonius TaxID=109634 RepID=A0A9P5NZ70_GYMJU|nr:hypothetical protein CPB84DRAFT_1217804 [Gymnopilus junonius]